MPPCGGTLAAKVIAEAKRLGNERMRKCLLQESNELVSIYVVIVRKLKNK